MQGQLANLEEELKEIANADEAAGGPNGVFARSVFDMARHPNGEQWQKILEARALLAEYSKWTRCATS